MDELDFKRPASRQAKSQRELRVQRQSGREGLKAYWAEEDAWRRRMSSPTISAPEPVLAETIIDVSPVPLAVTPAELADPRRRPYRGIVRHEHPDCLPGEWEESADGVWELYVHDAESDVWVEAAARGNKPVLCPCGYLYVVHTDGILRRA